MKNKENKKKKSTLFDDKEDKLSAVSGLSKMTVTL